MLMVDDITADQWMTLGLCRTKCEDFAFGVVRGYECWCADYVPSPSKNKTDCNKKCPQYDQEYCGNPDSGSYGYIDSPTLRPKGTASDSTASQTVSAPTTSKTSSLPSTRTSATSSSHESESETTIITSVCLSLRIVVAFYAIFLSLYGISSLP